MKSERVRFRYDAACPEAGQKAKELRKDGRYNNVHLNRHENGVAVSASLKNNGKKGNNTNHTQTYQGEDDYRTFGYPDSFWD